MKKECNLTEKNISAKDVIDWLLHNWSMVIKKREMKEPYNSLILAGYANYDGIYITKNWKTSYWEEPDPINSRFEILDL